MLRPNYFRSFAKQLFRRGTYSFSYFYQPHDIIRSYENNTENNDKYEKVKYQSPITQKQRRGVEKKQFEELKKALTQQAQKELKGETEQKKEEKKDTLFAENEQPTPRKYDKILVKELYWNPRQNDIYTYNNRKIAYLKDFQEPFQINDEKVLNLLDGADKALTKKLGAHINTFVDPDFDPTEAQKSEELFVKNLQELKEMIPKINHRLYPNIALYLANKLRYKSDFLGIWSVLENEIFKILHNLSSLEIAKLRHAMAGTYPKAGSPKLHHAFIDIIIQDLPSCDVNELLYIYHAFRNLSNYKIHSKVYNELLARDLSKHFAADPDLVANVLYTYANCRIDKRDRKVFRETYEHFKEASNLIDRYFGALETSIPKMSGDALIRLALALTILRLENYVDLSLKIERALTAKAQTLDAFQTANALYAFSKINGGLMGGKEAFYKELEKNVLKYWDQFNNHEKARIYYAYTARGLFSKDLAKNFMPWIKDNMAKFDYAQLANVAYGLMFEDVKDREIWRAFAKNVSTQKHVCPIIHYRPLKIARYYIDSLFPEWDMRHYENTCFEAERYFSITRLKIDYERDEYYDMSRILNLELDFNFKIWLEWENLFVVDYAILPNKVGVLVQKDRDNLPFSNEAKPAYKLRQKILEANGWKILNVKWDEFSNLGPNRNAWIKEEVEKLLKATKDEIKKDEEYRRAVLFEALEEGIRSYTSRRPQESNLENKQ